MNKTAI